MARDWLLVHSPIVGPDTWAPVAEVLRAGGDPAVLAAVRMGEQAPFAERHVEDVAATPLPSGCRPVVVAHSGAGGLVAAIGHRLGAAGFPPAAYVLADAGVPATTSTSRLDQLREEAPDLATHLEALSRAGVRFPNWSDEQLLALVTDPGRRARLLDGLQPAPAGYWTEPLPVVPHWPDAPGAVLLFSDSYERTGRFGQEHGWPVHRLGYGNHFLPLRDPDGVAAALRSVVDEIVPDGN